MQQLKFRSLKKGDLDQLQNLFKQLTPRFNSAIDLQPLLLDTNCHSIVIEDTGLIIGFGALVVHRVPSKGEVGRIEDVIIDEKYRGKGLGEKLMQELIATARKENVLQIFLTSNSERVVARHLYETLGFEKRKTDVFKLTLV